MKLCQAMDTDTSGTSHFTETPERHQPGFQPDQINGRFDLGKQPYINAN